MITRLDKQENNISMKCIIFEMCIILVCLYFGEFFFNVSKHIIYDKYFGLYNMMKLIKKNRNFIIYNSDGCVKLMFREKEHYFPVNMHMLRNMLGADSCCYLINSKTNENDVIEITINARNFPLYEINVC